MSKLYRNFGMVFFLFCFVILAWQPLYAAKVQLVQGWNLLGTSYKMDGSIFDRPEIITVWKWDSENGNWMAWSPDEDIRNALQAKGFGVLEEIGAFQGFWVNAKQSIELEFPDNATDTETSDTVTFTENDIANFKIIGSAETPGYAYEVVISGNYAYVADVNPTGLRIIDISNPEKPVLKGQVTLYDYVWGADINGLVVAENYVYMTGDIAVDEGDAVNGLAIIDITNPANPEVVGTLKPSLGRYGGLEVHGNYVYVANAGYGLKIIDISDVTNPKEISGVKYPNDYVYANGVTVVDNYAYVAYGTAGLQIVDVSDVTNPHIVGSVATKDAQDVTVVGNYAYVADWDGGVKIIDISDVTNPTIVSALEGEGEDDWVGWVAREISVVGDYAFVANDHGRVIIINISDVTNPQVIDVNGVNKFGSLDPGSWAMGIKVAGEYVYVASYDEGLQIFGKK